MWGGPTAPAASPVASSGPATPTPFQPAEDTRTPTPSLTETPSGLTLTRQATALWVSPAAPDVLHQFALISGLPLAATSDTAGARLGVIQPQPASPGPQDSLWIYALVAPFPTIPDGVAFTELQSAWKGIPAGPFSGRPLWMAGSTLAAFSDLWGAPAPGAVSVVSADQLVDSAWANRPAWGIVPFEALEPRWKVLSVDDQSPIHNDFNPSAYPLKIAFDLQPLLFPLLPTNRYPYRLTVLAMTGTTALVRGTEDKMVKNGVLYPGEDIRSVLRSADLTHVSNEVSFDPNCPTPDPYTSSLQFCSNPADIALLDDMGVDIVELTGNHLKDYGAADLLSTIDMYDQRGWLHYGGGRNLADALTPAKVTNNDNKLAFVGCNIVGPPNDWATDSTPGSAPCNLDQMAAEISQLRASGYLPIMTFQYDEYYQSTPTDYEQRDFRRMADAGAVIVSGSQAHMPATMELDNGSFIHYGLGNLFFDQMSHLMPDGSLIYDTRNEFVDRHVFYEGRYISTELLTFLLEDFSRPRPMTTPERTRFLQAIFTAAGW